MPKVHSTWKDVMRGGLATRKLLDGDPDWWSVHRKEIAFTSGVLVCLGLADFAGRDQNGQDIFEPRETLKLLISRREPLYEIARRYHLRSIATHRRRARRSPK